MSQQFDLIRPPSKRGIPLERMVAALADYYKGKASRDEVIDREYASVGKNPPQSQGVRSAIVSSWRKKVVAAGRAGFKSILDLCEDEGIATTSEVSDTPATPKPKKTVSKK